MHAEYIDQNFSRIRHDLVMKGLTYEQLQEDILDHICCMVEEEMEAGKDFETSYGNVMSQIGDSVLPDLQHQTLILLDKKFQRMKTNTYFLGLTGSILTILGAFFKMMHWPGASIIMFIGFLMVTLVFLPLYFILSYKEQTEKPKLVFPVVGYFTLAFILTGATFKIMHWPGASIMLKLSLIMVLVGFLPLYIVQVFKRTTGKKFNPAYLIMLLVGISIVLLLGRVNLSKHIIDKYTEAAVENIKVSGIVEERTGKLLEMADDSLGDARQADLDRIHEQAVNTLSMTVQMREALLEAIDESGKSIDQVSKKDNKYAARVAIKNGGLGTTFLQETELFKDLVLEQTDDPVFREEIRMLLDFTEEVHYQWKIDHKINDPMIMYYFFLTEYAKRIAISEYLVTRHLVMSGNE
ncbi:MAG: hypothetical protein WD052_04200 [Bacteroidales bacterium]